MNAPARISAETRQSFERNRAAIDAANGVQKARAHIDGTAYTALRIVQREVLETALKVKRARLLGQPDVERTQKVALFALLRVRRELRDTYPTARPFWQGMAA